MTTVYNRNGIAFNIDDIATDLNGKADTDLSNTTSKLSNSFLTKLMPDYANGISITFTASTTTSYTAPSKGFISLNVWNYGFSSGGTVTVNGNSVVLPSAVGGTSYDRACVQLYLDEGDIIAVTNVDIGTSGIFFPLKGAN